MKQALSKKWNLLTIALLFYIFFLLLTPLDRFNEKIPANFHKGFFSIIRFDIAADDGGHYAYLRSLFFDHDIDFFNEPFSLLMRLNKTTGYINNPWPIGASILWLPFFLLGHLITIILNIFGCNLSADGYSFPYISMIAIGSIFYGFLGIVFIYKSLCHFFKSEIALITVISAFFSSILTYYVYIRPYMDMSLDFFNLSLFIYLFTIFIVNKPFSKMFYLFFGIVCGMLSITRFNGVIYTISFFFYLFCTFLLKVKRREKIEWWSEFRNLFFVLVGFFITIAPQLIVNFILNGSLLNTGPAFGMNVSTFKVDIFIDRVVNILIGKTGILYQCPIYIIGFAGFVIISFLRRSQKNEKLKLFCISIFLAFFSQIMLTARLSGFGSEYGIKFLSSSIVLIMPGIAVFLDYFWGKRVVIAFSFVAIFLVIWQYIQLIQYKIIFDYNEFSVAKALSTIFLIIKSNINLLLRSSNIFALLSHGHFYIDTMSDSYFLIFIPLLLAIFISVSIVLIWKNVLSGIVKNKILILTNVIIFLLFPISLGYFLIRQPKKTQEEIKERIMLYSKLEPIEGNLVSIEFLLLDYALGIKKKDNNYFALIKYKNEVKGLNPATILNLP